MNELEAFKQEEIKNLKKLRFAAWMFLVLVDVTILIFFLYFFYDVYVGRNIETNFLIYVAPTILSIQGVLLLPLGFIGMLTYNRFHYALSEINSLNSEYLQRYQEYVYSIERAFAGIPPYLFTQKGMIVPDNFGQMLYPPNSIDKLTINIVKRGGLSRNIIQIYQNNKVKSSMNFFGFQQLRLDFLKTNVRRENPNVIIEEIERDTWHSITNQ